MATDMLARAMALDAMQSGGGDPPDLRRYVKKTDYASADSAGVIRTDTAAGTCADASGVLSLYQATEEDITAGVNAARPITSANAGKLFEVYGIPSRSHVRALTNALGYTVKNILPNRAVSTEFFTVQEDGSVLTEGATAELKQLVIYAGDAAPFKGKVLRLTGCPEGGSSGSYRMIMQNTSSGYSTIATDSGAGTTFTIDDSVTTIRLIISVYAGYSGGAVQFRPMLREGGVGDDTFEPYRPSVEERLAALEALLSATALTEE